MCSQHKGKSHVVDGWAIIMCKECHSGRCFAHILARGIHSSEALMTVDLDGKWHSIHANRRDRYDKAVPRLLWSTKMGHKIPIDERLVYFARTFQIPRPLSERVTFGFYDKKLPDPEEVSYQLIYAELSNLLNLRHQVDQLEPISVTDSEVTNSQTRGTPAQRHPPHLDSNSPAGLGLAEASSRKRKRPSETPNPIAGPDGPSRPRLSQPPAGDRTSERLIQTPQSSKRQRMECVLITTLPPKPRRRPAPPGAPGDEDVRSQVAIRRTEKQRGKRREVASTSRAPARSDSRFLADETMHSRSHSVSSIRPPLFEPVSVKPLRCRWLLILFFRKRVLRFKLTRIISRSRNPSLRSNRTRWKIPMTKYLCHLLPTDGEGLKANHRLLLSLFNLHRVRHPHHISINCLTTPSSAPNTDHLGPESVPPQINIKSRKPRIRYILDHGFIVQLLGLPVQPERLALQHIGCRSGQSQSFVLSLSFTLLGPHSPRTN